MSSPEMLGGSEDGGIDAMDFAVGCVVVSIALFAILMAVLKYR